MLSLPSIPVFHSELFGCLGKICHSIRHCRRVTHANFVNCRSNEDWGERHGRIEGKFKFDLKNIKNNSYFYFVHSYYVDPKDKEIILTETDYGTNFVSGINKDNIYGIQFHPERSGEAGLKILKEFCKC